MKIGLNTLKILKNFNALNPNLSVKPGNIIRTIAKEGSATLAMAILEETFEVPFAVSNLSKFLGAVSLFEEPEFEFFEKYVKISEGSNFVRYVYDEPSLLTVPPDKDIKMPSKDIEFDLDEKSFKLVLDASLSLQTPELIISGEDHVLYIKATDTKNPTITNFSMPVGVTDTDFKSIFNAANFKFIMRDYHVALCIGKIIEFKSDDLVYYMAARKE